MQYLSCTLSTRTHTNTHQTESSFNSSTTYLYSKGEDYKLKPTSSLSLSIDNSFTSSKQHEHDSSRQQHKQCIQRMGHVKLSTITRYRARRWSIWCYRDWTVFNRSIIRLLARQRQSKTKTKEISTSFRYPVRYCRWPCQRYARSAQC